MLRSYMPAQTVLMSVWSALEQRRWLWCLLAVLVIAIRHFLTDGAQPLGEKYGDTDDALRLLQIRDFIINGNWYDTRLTSIGAPEALHSHWSRLIDLPVAWLISIFNLFTPYLTAEKLAEIAWPLLLLFGLARFLVAEAERQMTPSGQDVTMRAGVILLVLLLLCASALFQFMPGRIDHHNVQIMFAVIGLLLLQRAVTVPRAGWAAGGALALGLVVGFESLPLIAASLGVACLLACFDVSARLGIARAVIGLFAGLLAGFAVTTHPAAWTLVECDRLSPNILALAGSGALAGGVLLMRYRAASHWVWIGGFAASGAVGLGLYLAANPVCANGAFTGLDPIVKQQWLARVIEGQSLATYFGTQPGLASAYLVTMLIALAVVIRNAYRSRSTTDILVAAIIALATLYGFYYIKFTPYGPLLSLVPMACWIANLGAIGRTPADSVRLRVIGVANQTFYVLIVSGIVSLYSSVTGTRPADMTMNVTQCTYRADIAALRSLPRGLIVSDIDLGPYIALATHHRAYAGPYHRIHSSIRDVLVLQGAPLMEAAGYLSAMNADYLVLCDTRKKSADGGAAVKYVPSDGTSADRQMVASKPEPAPKTFADHMRQGGAFAGLEPVSIGDLKGGLKVWKIAKPAP